MNIGLGAALGGKIGNIRDQFFIAGIFRMKTREIANSVRQSTVFMVVFLQKFNNIVIRV